MGINDLPGKSVVNGKTAPFYAAWSSMLVRCYSGRYPTYVGCSVCKEWLTLSNFKAWYDANHREGWALDKDIMIEGNRIYGPETCRYVPGYINSVLLIANAARGELPMGVHCDRRSPINHYRAHCADGAGNTIYGSVRLTASLAKADYARIKADVVRRQVLRAFDEGLSSDVCEALLLRNWNS